MTHTKRSEQAIEVEANKCGEKGLLLAETMLLDLLTERADLQSRIEELEAERLVPEIAFMDHEINWINPECEQSYVDGWNACRESMLAASPTPPAPVCHVSYCSDERPCIPCYTGVGQCLDKPAPAEDAL